MKRSRSRAPWCLVHSVRLFVGLGALAACSDDVRRAQGYDAGEPDAAAADVDPSGAASADADASGGPRANADPSSASAADATADAANTLAAAASADAAMNATGDAGVGAAAYGLDTRPLNATCIAPARAMLPATLKASGCVDRNDATRPATGLIPYDVNAPLWSDGAGKERFLALPDNTKIHINADDDWDLPAGSVLMKTFLLGQKRIETRLFVHHSDGWAGYSYQWDDAQTDATLVPDMTVDKQVGAQTWTFPSRKQCMECHTDRAGFSLGLETGQLNGDFTYPNGRRANQLATLGNIGLFDAPLVGAPTTLVRFPSPSGTDGTLETRGKAYVHANCSGCHRGANSPGMVKFDMRYQTPLGQMSICNVPTKKRDFGTAILVPGDPAGSAMLGHMRSPTKMRMPPLATSVVDVVGSLAVERWIAAVAACP